jgi:hypothetical protein
LSEAESAVLGSLEKVSDYPLYTLTYNLAYSGFPGAPTPQPAPADGGEWACSLFAALGQAEGFQFGRNFDWHFSPALLLYYDPPQGYASVSMVDIAYLDFDAQTVRRLNELPLAERAPLLDAPGMPFDGMNEHGLAIGMAAVPEGDMEPDSARPTIGSLGIIRLVLDNARTAAEALAIFERYNIAMSDGPPLHYLVADRAGAALLVEFYEAKMVVTPAKNSYHLATNFLVAAAPETPAGQCWRYDRLTERLAEQGGALDPEESMTLLAEVSQENTQWSVVYGLHSGEVRVVMGRQDERPLTFSLFR